ncbi:MBL fold metallo-hydrolase [Massilia sp. R798]|uniref:MBL fold metallo-hydrolase n=2 Tax=Massilia soli TaxID=2792854 RepID=A0ABS7SUF1_9BURK|nr:MBL fold metallo-hydrolase [Massilia soli]
MFFQRIKTKGLGHNAYMLGCGDGLAVIVDPRRDVDDYLALARANNLSIAYVIETHRQEDFEFGSASLAQLSGAKILGGTHRLSGRVDVALADGEECKVSTTRLVALATPGHTPESMCYAVYPADSGDQCWGVFTGDTLFVGDTGRTDLSDPERTAENAGILYDSVHAKLAPLGGQALILPAHGAGSACGGNISQRDDSTLGVEQATNPVFKQSRAQFIDQKVREKLPRPPYFTHMEVVNLDAGRALPPPTGQRILQPQELHRRLAEGLLIDTRSPEAFAASHIEGSYNIWLGGLSSFGGWIANDASTIFLVVDEGAQAPAAVAALARIGIDGVAGVLAKGVAGWREAGLAVEASGTTSALETSRWMEDGDVHVLDVRDDMEWEEKHIPGAHHMFVGYLEANPLQVPHERKIVVHCSVGHRAGLAVSILRRQGFSNVYNMLGGLTAWEKLDLPLTGSDRQ